MLKLKETRFKGGKTDIVHTLYGIGSDSLEQKRNISLGFIIDKGLREDTNHFPEDKAKTLGDNREGNNIVQVISKFTIMIFYIIFIELKCD